MPLLLVCAGLFLQWQIPRPRPSSDLAMGSGASLFEQGVRLLQAEKIDSSHLFFDAAKKKFQEEKNTEGVVKSAYYRARLDNRNAHLQFDTVELDKAFALAEAQLPDANYWRAKIWLGRGIHFFWKTPYLDSAEHCFNRAKQLFLQLENWEGVVESTFYIARVFGNRQDRDRQWDELQYAIQTMRQRLPKVNFWTGEVLYYTASRYLNKLDTATAHAYLREAKDIHREIKEWNSYLKTCNYLAEFCLEKQHFAEMKQHLDEAAECVRQNPAWERRMQEIHQYYGKYYSRIGDYEAALDNYEKVFDFVIEDSLYLAYHFYSMGSMLLEQNDLEGSDSYLQNALIHAQRHGQDELFAPIQTHFGTIAERQGNVLSALQAHRTALQEAEALRAAGKDDYNEGLKSIISSNLALARIFLNADLLDSAHIYLVHNQSIHQKYPYLDYATYGLWGEWYSKKGQYAEALAALQEAVRRCKAVYGNQHPDIADLCADIGAICELQEQPVLALAYYQYGLNALEDDYSIYKLAENPDLEDISALLPFRRLLVSKAHILQDQGQAVLAYQTTELAIRAIERLQTSFKTEGSKLFAQQQALPTYERSIELAWWLYGETRQPLYAWNAFRYAEQNKSLLLLDALRSDEAERFGGIPDSLLERESELQRTLLFYQQQLTEARRQRDTIRQKTAQSKILEYSTGIEKLQSYLESNFPKYYEVKYAPRLATIGQIQERLPEGGELIEYFVGNEAIYAFGINRDTFVFQRFDKSKLFEDQIHHFYNSVSTYHSDQEELHKQYHQYVQSGELIYERLLKPLLLPGTDRLFIVPDAQLHYVAFEALLTKTVPVGEDVFFKNLPYLLNDYSVHYHYSASLWVNHRQFGRNRGQVLAMAASYDSTDWTKTRSIKEQSLRRTLADIPGARIEVDKLELNFKGTFLKNGAANEASFKELATSGDYSIIHLATHGLMDKRNPSNSGLVFTKTDDSINDDILNIYEINLMQLNCDLVVLSACETGYGKIEKGEGVLSIGRGFMYAGVPSLLSTFWPLNDQTSPIIMAAFYRNLGEHQAKDEALRNAKLRFLKQTQGLSAHPFFWASFATIGDEAPMRLANPVPFWSYLYVLVCFGLYFGVGWRYGGATKA